MCTCWFVNTDEKSVKNIKSYDLWFTHGMAFSGGDWEKYGLPLGNLKPLDILFMYHNRIGIVGVGRVLEFWDRQCYEDKLLYQSYDYSEYRIRVDWNIDLRASPVDPRLEFGYVPRVFLQRIVGKRNIARDFVSRLEENAEFRSPEEVGSSGSLLEGERKSVIVDVRERNPIARKKCIEYWGAKCQVCGFEFHTLYGPIGQDYIHVHHLFPLQLASGKRSVSFVDDLRPVCANCHAIIHKKNPPYTIEEVRTFIEIQSKN